MAILTDEITSSSDCYPDQPALRMPTMHLEEEQPALCRPTMHPEEEQPALCWPTMYPEEDQPVLHRLIMHRDEDQPVVQFYAVNYGSLVGTVVAIFRVNNSTSIGSGFVWDGKGHIVTNWHVIKDDSDFRVTFFDRTTYGAKVIGFCKSKDVAVMHAVELEGKLEPRTIGLSANLRAGDPIIAIGSPFGLDHSLTTGAISFLGRVILSPNGRPIRDVIQIDAAINPGYSGGPLFDRCGSLIGINTTMYSPSGAFCGVGYSISIDSVRDIIDQLVTDGKVLHPHLGITVSSVLFRDESEWLLVVDVAVDGPAAKAGLQKTDPLGGILGDLITSVNGKMVTNSNDLLLILDLCKEGEKVTLEVLRGGHKKNISVTLELNPDESESEVMLSKREKFKC